MLERLTNWYRSWRDSRRLCRALVNAARAERRATKVLHRLARADRGLRALQREVEAEVEAGVEDLEAAAASQRQMQRAMEELRAQVDLDERVIIPGLTDNQQAMVEQTRALISLNVQAQGGSRQPDELR